MYLDFVKDIIKAGDYTIVTCHHETIEGIVVKISNELLAIKKTDGIVEFIKDEQVIDIKTKGRKDDKQGISDIGPDDQQEKARHGMILVKKEKPESFHCSICNKDKVSKKYAIEVGNPNIRICNACYGWTLARLDSK